MPDDEKKVPTIILKVTNFEKFNVEINFETPHLEFARLMLDTAIKTIERMQRDQEALSFGEKMRQAAQARNAISKPLIKM